MKKTFIIKQFDFKSGQDIHDFIDKIRAKGLKAKMTIESIPVIKKKKQKLMKEYMYEYRLYLAESKDEIRRRLNIGYNDQKEIKLIKEITNERVTEISKRRKNSTSKN